MPLPPIGSTPLKWSVGAAAGHTVDFALRNGVMPYELVDDLPNQEPMLEALRQEIMDSGNPIMFPNTSIFNEDWDEVATLVSSGVPINQVQLESWKFSLRNGDAITGEFAQRHSLKAFQKNGLAMRLNTTRCKFSGNRTATLCNDE